MTTVTISLPTSLGDWVDQMVRSGDYVSTDEYVEDLIARDRADRIDREALIGALGRGEASGIGTRDVLTILSDLRPDCP